MRYSLDTSALLEGWRRSYPPDVFPSIWDRLDHLGNEGHLAATEEVLEELEKQDDDVCQWLKSRPHMVVPIDNEIQPVVLQILAQHERLVDTRKSRLQADPFVIALAQVESCVVVTQEKHTGKLHKPNIPDVCDAMGIPVMNLVQLFRQLGLKL